MTKLHLRFTRKSTLVTRLQPTVRSHTVSRLQTTLFCMMHLTCGTSTILLFVFLISLVHHLPYCHALIMDRLLIFLMAFFTLVFQDLLLLKVFRSRAICSSLSLISWKLTTLRVWQSVTGESVIAECGRLNHLIAFGCITNTLWTEKPHQNVFVTSSTNPIDSHKIWYTLSWTHLQYSR